MCSSLATVSCLFILTISGLVKLLSGQFIELSFIESLFISINFSLQRNYFLMTYSKNLKIRMMSKRNKKKDKRHYFKFKELQNI